MWLISYKVSLIKMLPHNNGTKKVPQMGRRNQDNIGVSFNVLFKTQFPEGHLR